jgi:hypothetical protein
MEDDQRRVADAGLQDCEVALGYAGRSSQHASRHATTGAQRSHALAEGAQQGRLLQGRCGECDLLLVRHAWMIT